VFIQVIQGHVNDADAMREQHQMWVREVMPGAAGFIGSTVGVTADNQFVAAVRFESADAAAKNAARPEQDAFWSEAQKLFDGEVRFRESEDVHVMQHGDPDSAQFVQVMIGTVTSRDEAVALDQKAEAAMTSARPDVIGAVSAYFDGGEFVTVSYFTSEAEARRNEKAEIPSEFASMMADFERIMKVDQYLDLTDPWLTTK
jgi:hypothetical protein